MESDAAELIRKRYLYRRLILRGKTRVSHGSAVKMVGPDCAYHLYPTVKGKQTTRPDESTDD